METIQNETLQGITELLQSQDTGQGPGLQTIAQEDHRYIRDIKVNLSNALSYATLSRKESYLLALAVAVNEKNEAYISVFRKLAEQESATVAEIADVYACVSLMNVNNVFYRFRHFTGKEFYEKTPAGIKMSIMMNPVMGKELFELMSLTVSAVNGCERCVTAHEASLIQLGTSGQRIYDAIRLTAIVKGFLTIA
jgi:alkyl hydroperoxide reductase subunit D